MLQPAAFLSYVHSDDEHDGGRISKIRERLSAEVKMQTGRPFPIFQDHDIEWGENWRRRIVESLSEVTFLIPIITPSFFESAACREELERFLELEQELKRDDLILPIYYVNCKFLNDQNECQKDKLATVIASRQYDDWRSLRFEELTSPQIAKRIERLALQMTAALDSRVSTSETDPTSTPNRKRVGPDPKSGARDAKGAAQLSRETEVVEPTTFVVDKYGRGHYKDISDAIAACPPGGRVIVRRGLYLENLTIEKPIEVIGDGSLSDIIVRSTEGPTLTFRTNLGRIANITLFQTSGKQCPAVEVVQGRPVFECCRLSSRSAAAVTVSGDSYPTFVKNQICDSEQEGVLIFDGARATLEDNDIYNNGAFGVQVVGGANVSVRSNRIHHCGTGIGFFDGYGLAENNDIFAHDAYGISITEGSNPVVRQNRVHENDSSGITAFDGGRGIIEDNDVYENAYAGIDIENSDTMVRANRIRDNQDCGIEVHYCGKGTIEENSIVGNKGNGIEVNGSNPLVVGNKVIGNGQFGISLIKAATGTYTRNHVEENRQGPWSVSPDSSPNILNFSTSP